MRQPARLLVRVAIVFEVRVRVLGCCVIACALGIAPSALGSSLPKVKSGELPGPPLLYEDAPKAPILSVDEPFRADPLLVSGSDAYRDGEYLFQDYLFDDRGANTVPGSGSRSEPGTDTASPTAGDVIYPTAGRFANNAADIVELRIAPTRKSIVYRLTLNTVKDDDAAVVGIGIDTDGGGPALDWPGGAGISSPGIDGFITAWGTGGEVARNPSEFGAPRGLPNGAVTIDRKTNQMEISVPRKLMDPKRSAWRYVAGTGLYAGDGAAGGRRFQQVETGEEPRENEPVSGSSTRSAPSVFNLAFRFDEPQGGVSLAPDLGGLLGDGDGLLTGPSGVSGSDTFPGVGNWFEDKQANLLSDRTTGDFHADVDFGALADDASQSLNSRAGNEQARIFASSLDVPEGVDQGKFPAYGGQLQPYILTVPPGYDGERPRGLTFSLHSLGGTYTQYGVFSPNQLRQFGDERGDFVATPLGRGTDGWYTDEAESDFFEVWADVARNFELKSEQVALSGYSMGGYGTYKLGTQYPDLFGRAFTTVGPPAREVWIPPADPVIISSGGLQPNESSLSNLVLENARSIPFLNWIQRADELVPFVGPEEQQNTFDRLGLRSTLRTFVGGDHFTLAVLDEWDEARDFLGKARVKRDPGRVNYAFLPAADRPALGLIHDHAYWVSDLRARDTSGDPGTNPSRAEIDTRSLAFGKGDPATEAVSSADPPGAAGPDMASTLRGTVWRGVQEVAKSNRLLVDLDNVSRATIDGRRARLDGGELLRVRLESDGEGRLRLELPLPRGAVARRIDGSAPKAATAAPEVALDRDGATFEVAGGAREYEIRVRNRRDSGSGEGDRDRDRRDRGFSHGRGVDVF